MSIKKPLAALYLISGDVPLLTQEMRDAIFLTAKAEGFSEKITLHVGIDYSFEKLFERVQNHSLFSEKTLIDIRNPQAKWDKETLDFFNHYLQNTHH
ncbi:MAG TPA: DNA polymerase III subunit delta, partial [Coxiellaceae bacterium]|nr:DNA polymerase III subunit delta [Coxiellaceae bacterium]